jgi:hypothetical protein
LPEDQTRLYCGTDMPGTARFSMDEDGEIMNRYDYGP